MTRVSWELWERKLEGEFRYLEYLVRLGNLLYNISILNHWYHSRDWFSLSIKNIVWHIPYFLVQFFLLVPCLGSVASTLIIFGNDELWSNRLPFILFSSLVMSLANEVGLSTLLNSQQKAQFFFMLGLIGQYFSMFLEIAVAAKMKACCINAFNLCV